MVESFEIGGRQVGYHAPPYIIAEIGQNHNGDCYTATRMVSMAVRAGCDAVKFQLRNAEAEIAANQLQLPHPSGHHAFGPTYGEHRKALDFGEQELRHIASRIVYNEWPVQWFATPCYLGAVEVLERLNVPAYKIASKDLTNLPLIREAASTGKPIILSTGMDGLHEIGLALAEVYRCHEKVVVMHCVSQYPCELENVNLSAIVSIRDEFGCLVGYSDHTVGILAPALAVNMGAVMIEKHITLSRAMKGSDQAGAVEEDGLYRIVRDCHAACIMHGDGEKEPPVDVEAARYKLRGSVVACRPLHRGDTLEADDIALKAPGGGLTWVQAERMLGRVVTRDLEPDEQLREGDVL
jgi:sialic acid synthase SpsE